MNFENRYSVSDRVLHRLGFNTWSAQLALSDLEDRLFLSKLDNVPLERSIFITSLPRAGTTMLLNVIVSDPRAACHRYRDLPFLLCPMFWNHFSSRFISSDDELRERAHGDGIFINSNSPEAFEEIIWRVFWPEHYRKDRIIPWGEDGSEEFAAFLKSHYRKIIFNHRKKGWPASHYVSKANLNISRISLLLRMFPNSRIIIPFRDPLEHAYSLFTQHKNFLALHARDSFAKYYMNAIGHFDFGENLRPIDFGGWLPNENIGDFLEIEAWLQYWIVAFETLLKERDHRVIFLPYEGICKNPEVYLERISKLVFGDVSQHIMGCSSTIRARSKSLPRDYERAISKDLLADASELYHGLYERTEENVW